MAMTPSDAGAGAKGSPQATAPEDFIPSNPGATHAIQRGARPVLVSDSLCPPAVFPDRIVQTEGWSWSSRERITASDTVSLSRVNSLCQLRTG